MGYGSCGKGYKVFNMQTKRVVHMGVTRRVLRYVQGTLTYEIEYKRDNSATLTGYCDADWVRSEDGSRSTSSYAFSFGSGLFLWAYMKQNTISLSTAKAEYV